MADSWLGTIWDGLKNLTLGMGSGLGTLVETAVYPFDKIASMLGDQFGYHRKTFLEQAMDQHGYFDGWKQAMGGVGEIFDATGVSWVADKLAIPLDYTSDLIASTVLSWRNDTTWGQGWDITHNAPAARQISPGQAVGLMFTDVDWRDEKAMEELKSSSWWNFSTGVLDAANSLFLDPLVLGGKAAKAVRVISAERPVDAVSQLAKSSPVFKAAEKIRGPLSEQEKVSRIDGNIDSTNWAKFWEWSRTSDEGAINQLPGLRDNEYGREISHLLKTAQTKDQFDLLGRIGQGEFRALQSLQAQNSALGASAKVMLAQKQSTANLIKNPLSLPARDLKVAQAKELYANSEEFKVWRDRVIALDQASPNFMADSTVGGFKTPFGEVGFDSRLNRASRRYKATQKPLTGSTKERIQQADGFKEKILQAANPVLPVVRIMQLARKGSAPQGWADFNRDDWFNEYENMLSLTPVGEETKAGLRAEAGKADSIGSRAAAGRKAERVAMASIAHKHGYDEAAAQKIIDQTHSIRDVRMQRLRSKAYSATPDENTGLMLDEFMDEDGSIAKLPLHLWQETNYAPVMDVATLDSILKQPHVRNGIQAAMDNGLETTKAVADFMSGMWKSAVLLRLGYPMRVLTDDHFRMLVKLGALTYGDMMVGREGRLKDLILRRKHGLGTLPVMGKEFQDALGLSLEESPWPDLISGNASTERELEIESSKWQRRLRGDAVFRTIHNDEPNHLESWLSTLNKSVKFSPPARMVLEGKSRKEIAKWIHTTDEGRLLKRTTLVGTWTRLEGTDGYIARVKADMDNLLPADSGLREKLLEGKLTTDDLAGAYTDASRRPNVAGVTTEYNQGRGPIHQAYKQVVAGLYKRLGQMPTDQLSRNPYFVSMYRSRIRRNAQIMVDRGQPLTDDLRRQLEKGAREYALRNVRDLLYDVSARSNLANTMRLVSPFFSAYQDSMNTWLGLMRKDPSLFPRSVTIWNAPNQATDRALPLGFQMQVVDADGQPIQQDADRAWWKPSNDQYVRMQVPDWFANNILRQNVKTKSVVIDGVKHNVGAMTVDLNKSSLFSIAQGEIPYLPSGGPFVQIPVGMLVKAKPDLANTFKFMLPFGPPSSAIQAALPNAWRQMADTFFGDSSDESFASQMWSVMQAEIAKYNAGDRDTAPKWEEIENRARMMAGLKAFSAFSLPFSTSFRSPFQYFIDTYHQFLRGADPTNPNRIIQNADEEFYNRFGDTMYIFTASINKSNTKIPATRAGYQLSQKYADLVADSPELGRLVVGPLANGDFDTAVYRWQQSNEAAPGSGVYHREKLSPEEALKNYKAELGWQQYRKLRNNLEGQAKLEGYDSLHDPGAEQYQAVIDQYVKAQSDPDSGNRVWWEDYSTQDDSKMIRRVQDLQKLVNSRLVNDPQRNDLRILRQYLQERERLVAQLRMQKDIGEPSTLQAKANEYLLYEWNTVRQTLKDSDTNFADLFNTYLEFDNLQYI